MGGWGKEGVEQDSHTRTIDWPAGYSQYTSSIHSTEKWLRTRDTRQSKQKHDIRAFRRSRPSPSHSAAQVILPASLPDLTALTMLANFARQFTLRTTATAVRPAAVVARQFAGTSGTGGAGAPARAPPRLWQLQLREQRGAQRACRCPAHLPSESQAPRSSQPRGTRALPCPALYSGPGPGPWPGRGWGRARGAARVWRRRAAPRRSA